jgi:hypothetical protein
MLVGVTEAARLTGKSRATIYRKMQSGEVSFIKEGDKEALLDTSELIRVFGPFNQKEALREASGEAPRDNQELQRLRAENERLIALLEAEKRHTGLLQENVNDLRKAMLLLEHKTLGEAPAEAPRDTVRQQGLSQENLDAQMHSDSNRGVARPLVHASSRGCSIPPVKPAGSNDEIGSLMTKLREKEHNDKKKKKQKSKR